MMTALDPKDVAERIRTYVASNLLFSDGAFPYADDTSFLEEGIVDSMGIIELVTFVEKQFGTSVQDHELVPDNFDSVSQLTAFILRKAAA